MQVHDGSLATVLRVDGEIDASNANLVTREIGRIWRLDTPLIVDLGTLDFLGIAGLRGLLELEDENQPQLFVITGPALQRLTRVISDAGLPIVHSVPEAVRLIEEALQAGRRLPQTLPDSEHRRTRPGRRD
ncbi:STAS domain-containing protein [Mycobacterium riyadhense]|uniref:STAS domain-containing protein n=1 Tax=Mycobacterium riyadhense TaxID=486698 RepID=UPI00195BF21D|nr:STAS domain-containing protein [Mycobacterium riyadhense]